MKKRMLLLLASVILLTAVTSACAQAPSDITLRQQYAYFPSNDLSPSWIVFSDNNEFQFIFSVASSYIGEGTYKLNGDKLVLDTYDGEYHYTFSFSGDDLVFDAKNSSEMLWFGSFSDGSIFEPFNET